MTPDLNLVAPSVIRVFPYAEGRYEFFNCGPYEVCITDGDGQRLNVELQARRTAGETVPVDFNHQPAVHTGQLLAVADVPGRGVLGYVNWLRASEDSICGGGIHAFSPQFSVSRDGGRVEGFGKSAGALLCGRDAAPAFGVTMAVRPVHWRRDLFDRADFFVRLVSQRAAALKARGAKFPVRQAGEELEHEQRWLFLCWREVNQIASHGAISN